VPHTPQSSMILAIATFVYSFVHRVETFSSHGAHAGRADGAHPALYIFVLVLTLVFPPLVRLSTIALVQLAPSSSLVSVFTEFSLPPESKAASVVTCQKDALSLLMLMHVALYSLLSLSRLMCSRRAALLVWKEGVEALKTCLSLFGRP
jgi:hypothetical protein